MSDGRRPRSTRQGTADFFVLLSDHSSKFSDGSAGVADYDLMRSAKRREIVLAAPISVKLGSRGELGDVVWVATNPIVRNRVFDALSNEGITGWQSYPVDLRASSGRMIPGYQGLAISGRCASISIDKDHHAELVYEDNPRGRFPHYRGLSFTKDSWDGTDIFVGADGRTDWIVMSERLSRLVKALKVTHVETTAISDVTVFASDQPAVYRDPQSGALRYQ